ncbi:hypothetical protein [Patulibacter sp. SYSU D01012]|uniref:hypothetical protein n=1 Tax=Patulibacter sp. SYSU D01012 TaxID=2817381 RepID=UPI001B3052EC|nr:hypothetical protein [Patulibacter sp. SYSU D01012]
MGRRTIAVVCTGLAAAGGLTACGRTDPADKPNASRPPTQLQLSAAITDRGVSLSPDAVGGGPVRIVINNLTQRSLRPRLTRGGGPTASTRRRVAPGGVATIQADLRKGAYRLTAGDAVAPAQLTVGRRRPSADGELLLP